MEFECQYAVSHYDRDTGETWYECRKYPKADDCECCPEYVETNFLGDDQGENDDN